MKAPVGSHSSLAHVKRYIFRELTIYFLLWVPNLSVPDLELKVTEVTFLVQTQFSKFQLLWVVEGSILRSDSELHDQQAGVAAHHCHR